MSSDLAELSSIASTLEALTRRVAGMGEAAEHAADESLATQLFAVERALEGAQRRLKRLLQRAP
ncbi:MAG: hypothetical protein M0Z69_07310 [Actinomycetota bacterium]|nr:hypothetical protein [Actinomycetota bacterium]